MAADNSVPALSKMIDAAIARAIADAVIKRHQRRAQTPDLATAQSSNDATA